MFTNGASDVQSNGLNMLEVDVGVYECASVGKGAISGKNSPSHHDYVSSTVLENRIHTY